MDDPLFETAAGAAASVRRREISSRELTRALLERIEAVNPALNAVVELRGEAALREAEAADGALAAGRDTGPLHGVPMTIKESFNVAGAHTTWGNPAFKDYVAERDATVVQRLRRAGAIIVGKTNVPFMLGDYGQTANDLYGVTNNPWDAARTPGGSTGGGAAALAAGLTFLEYGSDLVGSIRIPAHFCGVYGLRPTANIVPPTGFQPPGPPAGSSEMLHMSALGPLGRSAGDLRTALRVTAGPDQHAAKAFSWTLPPSRRIRLRDFRVGVVLDHPHAPVSSEVALLLAATVDAVARAGASIVEGWPDGMDPVQQYETFGFQVRSFLALQEPVGVDFAPLSQFIDQEHRRMSARATWAAYFDDVDVFLCPPNFTPAFPHDTRPFEQRTIATPDGERRYDSQPFWISHGTLAGQPAAVAPIGSTPAGLPVGVQIVGPRFEDDTVITFAELLADVVGGYAQP